VRLLGDELKSRLEVAFRKHGGDLSLQPLILASAGESEGQLSR
jgi:hypothetical protein